MGKKRTFLLTLSSELNMLVRKLEIPFPTPCFLPSVRGEAFISSDLAWTWSVCHVIDPGALHFPQILLEHAMHFPGPGDSVKFN